ncbi:MAG: hypothetical protein IJV89_04840 [Lentisphaeria bacterium]|nr:hypothetical protein [Lentisphaeria bacterium]
MDFLQRKFLVRHHEAGLDGLLRLAPLFDMFQDAAAEHAQILGCGMDYLQEQGKAWVLSRIAVEISRMPAIGETVTVETYPTGVERLFAIRQFTVTDEAGSVIARATSCWLLLDAAALRPLRIVETLGTALPMNEDKPRHFPVPARIAALPEKVAENTYTVRHSLVDVNQHLNNAFFAAFVHDMLGTLTGENRAPATLQILFQHAGTLGADIVCRGGLENGSEFRMEGRSPDGETVYFQAQGTL